MVCAPGSSGQHPCMACLLKLINDLPNTLADLIWGPAPEIIYLTVDGRRYGGS
jgi:hypothetical protein